MIQTELNELSKLVTRELNFTELTLLCLDTFIVRVIFWVTV